MSRVRLGDIVTRIKDFEDKDATNLLYYVGGEHFDNRSLTVNRKGIIKGSTIGPAFHTKFRSGDVLLMSRNPHLRKSGLVDFEGICSDVSYIIRTKDEKVIKQKFIPLLFQSDIFWDFAERNKKGSTNFFLNWSDFERFEFDLPDIKEQEKLCEVLWAIDDTVKSYQEQIKQCDELVKGQFVEMFGNPISNDKKWKTEKISIIAPEYSPVLKESDKYWCLNLDAIENNTGKILQKEIIPKEKIGSSTSTFDNTMVLYSKLRPYLNKVIVPNDEGYATTELVGLKPNSSKLNKYFFLNLLLGNEFVEYATKISGGSQMPRMPMNILRNFECILPPIELQNQFAEFYKHLDKSKFAIKEAMNSAQKMFDRILTDNLSK